ncbi:hypothetical protein ABW21_db0201134 [Orbilia brochopaga]|nr:hypothetical protein ABW21_db0201134 [Drechslerella brochopaga]
MAYEALIVLAPLASIGAATLIIAAARGITILIAQAVRREQLRQVETRYFGRPLKRRERRAILQQGGYMYQMDDVLPGYTSRE